VLRNKAVYVSGTLMAVTLVAGLVVPGGESTTIGKLLVRFGVDQAIRDLHAAGKPIFGTCAGAILLAREVVEGCYIVTAKASDSEGRTDESIGAVPIEKIQGEARANAMMKAETKAKRRVTLSFCGLGMLDETEVDSIPGAVVGEQAQPTGVGNGKAVDSEIVPPKDKTQEPSELPKTGDKKPSPLKMLIAKLAQAGKVGAPDVLKWMTEQLKKPIKATKDITEAEIATLTEAANAILKETT